jgi:hypothetical protein
MQVFQTYVTISRPMDGDAGRIEVGHYVVDVDGDTVTLTDQAGVPIKSGRMQIGYTAKVGAEEGPRQAANRLLWRHYRGTKSGSDFNRPLRYPKSYVV